MRQIDKLGKQMVFLRNTINEIGIMRKNGIDLDDMEHDIYILRGSLHDAYSNICRKIKKIDPEKADLWSV